MILSRKKTFAAWPLQHVESIPHAHVEPILHMYNQFYGQNYISCYRSPSRWTTSLLTWKSTSIATVMRSHVPTWTESKETEHFERKYQSPLLWSNFLRAGLRLEESGHHIYPSKTTNRLAQMGATQCNSLCPPTILLNAWVNLHQSPLKKSSGVLASTSKSTHSKID